MPLAWPAGEQPHGKTTSPHETRVTQRSPTLPACPSVRWPVRRAGRAAGRRSWLVAAWFAVSAAGAQAPDERTLLGEVPAGLTEASSLTDDLGADSLDLLEIVMALEDELDLTADEKDFVGVRTVGEAVDVLARLAG